MRFSPKPGVTIVEILIGLVLIGLVAMLIYAIFSANLRLFLTQITGIGIAEQNKLIIDTFTNETRQAESIVNTCENNACPDDITGDLVIVYRIWSLDAAGNPTDSTYDYLAFRQDPQNTTNFIRKIYPNPASTRAGGNDIIATNLAANGLDFDYNSADPTQASQVTITVTTTSTESGKTQTITNSAKAKLRNKPAIATQPNWTLQSVNSARTTNDPDIATLDPNRIFISFEDANTGELKLAKSTDGGNNWTISIISSGGVIPSLQVFDANNIAVAYQDTTGPPSFDYRLMFAKSTDGGNNWTTVPVDTDPTLMPLNLAMSAPDPSHLFISYYDFAAYDLQFAKSTDGGNNWIKSRIDTAGNVGGQNSIKAVDINTVFIGYRGSNGLKFAKSTDGGTNWTKQDVASGGASSISIDATSTTTIFISYYDSTADRLKFAKSTDGGSNWTTSTIGTETVRFSTSIAALNTNTIYIAYAQRVGFDTNIKLAESTDGGSNWQISQVANNPSLDEEDAALSAFDINNIFVSYHQEDPGGGYDFLYLAKRAP